MSLPQNLEKDQVLIFENPAIQSLNNPFIKEAISEFDNLLALGDFEKGEEILNSLCSKYTENVEFPLKLGHLMYRLRKYAKAEYYYKIALEKNNQSFTSEIYFGLGQSYYHSERYSDSHLAFTFLVDNDPEFKMVEIAYFKLASIMKILKDYNKAVEYLLKCLKTKTKNKNIIVETLCQLGSVYEMQGKSRISFNFYIQASETIKNFRTVCCLAWGYLNVKPSTSDAICHKYLMKFRPQHESSDIYFLKALAQMKLKNLSKACLLLEEYVIFNLLRNHLL